MKILIRKLVDKFGVNWIFLFVVLILYFVLACFDLKLVINSIDTFVDVFVNHIIFVLIVIFIFMVIFDSSIQIDKVKKIFKTSSNKFKYFIALVGWILSTGPVYMRYPFLKELKENGFTYWQIATFIYSRWIKLPLLPAMIYYLGIKYTLIFNLVILFFSILEGLILDFYFKYF